MVRMLLKVVICLVLGVITPANAATAQSQREMNDAAGRELRAVEAEMNAALDRLFKLAEGKPRSVAKLRDAQSAWLAFRDAHIKAYWPSEESGTYGSVHPMCVAHELARLTRARLVELRAMTDRVEGDVCACQWPD